MLAKKPCNKWYFRGNYFAGSYILTACVPRPFRTMTLSPKGHVSKAWGITSASYRNTSKLIERIMRFKNCGLCKIWTFWKENKCCLVEFLAYFIGFHFGRERPAMKFKWSAQRLDFFKYRLNFEFWSQIRGREEKSGDSSYRGDNQFWKSHSTLIVSSSTWNGVQTLPRRRLLLMFSLAVVQRRSSVDACTEYPDA